MTAAEMMQKSFICYPQKKALITACKKSGLPHFGHHSMRHFFCSNAIEAGCDFKVIAEWLRATKMAAVYWLRKHTGIT